MFRSFLMLSLVLLPTIVFSAEYRVEPLNEPAPSDGLSPEVAAQLAPTGHKIMSGTRTLCEVWGMGAAYEIQPISQPHEAHYLKLDCSKAAARLGWQPRWDLRQGLEQVVEWTKAYQVGANMRQVSLRQIQDYEETMVEQT